MTSEPNGRAKRYDSEADLLADLVGGRTRSVETQPDGKVALYHVVRAHETFEDTAPMLFEILLKAQEVSPGAKRALFLDIEGHRNDEGGFDWDMLELQREYTLGFLGPFLSEVHLPLGTYFRDAQRDDIPFAMEIHTP